MKGKVSLRLRQAPLSRGSPTVADDLRFPEMRAVLLLAVTASAWAATLGSQAQLQPALRLRGGTYPPPKAGYHALAAKGAAATKQEVVPNLVSGALSGAYVSFGAVLSLTVASAMPGFTDGNPGVSKLVFGTLFPIALLLIVVTGSQVRKRSACT